MKLSINLNKIALLRNSRGSNNPDIKEFAITALEENILGLTVHPRPDNRHITYDDLKRIKILTSEYNKEFNIEYLELRNKNNLSKKINKKNVKIFIAFYIQGIRLIDNF